MPLTEIDPFAVAVQRLATGIAPPVVATLDPEAEAARVRGAGEPVAWISERLGEILWSKQREICEAVRDYRKTAVRSCHEPGKSFTAARLATWWIDSHAAGEAFVVTSAPTGRQVRAILWREITRAHTKGHLAGRLNQTEWWMTMVDGHEELVAFGQKPKDLDPDAFQGIHARFVLVIFDEACGMPPELWEAAESLIANENSRFLAIGNPDDPSSQFKKVCDPGSGWHTISISAFETPNFTDEPVPERLKDLLIGRTYVAEKRALGETSPTYVSKVLGRFPEEDSDGLIRLSWVLAAQQRERERREAEADGKGIPDEGPVELGADIAGEGHDLSIIAERRGRRARIREVFHEPDTMVTTGKIIRALVETGATIVRVDKIGIGHGVADRLAEQQRPVAGVNVGEGAVDRERFRDLKAELFWGLRDRFEAGDIDLDPEDELLAQELVAIRYKPNSRGQILIEEKRELKKRLGRSPDRAEALMLAFAPIGGGGMDLVDVLTTSEDEPRETDEDTERRGRADELVPPRT